MLATEAGAAEAGGTSGGAGAEVGTFSSSFVEGGGEVVESGWLVGESLWAAPTEVAGGWGGRSCLSGLLGGDCGAGGEGERKLSTERTFPVLFIFTEGGGGWGGEPAGGKNSGAFLIHGV